MIDHLTCSVSGIAPFHTELGRYPSEVGGQIPLRPILSKAAVGYPVDTK